MTPLHIVSSRALDVVPATMLRAPTTVVAASLHDVTRALTAQAARPPTSPIAIDLVGHSTSAHQLLRLGSTVIDALDLAVFRFFEAIGRSGILRDINAVCLRLLGCETATSPCGVRTMRLLSSVLEIPVYGSRKRLSRTHHTAQGFNPIFRHVLVDATGDVPPAELT
jgi:hypothetical protein